MADEINNEALAQLVAVSLVIQQIPDIEEIARMLPVESRRYLAGI
jgi:hypothetical protein